VAGGPGPGRRGCEEPERQGREAGAPFGEALTPLDSIPALPELDPGPGALTALARLIAERRPAGASIFDLFLVAEMRSHGIATICMGKGADFDSIAGIGTTMPEDVVARLR
jgi:hypothetical protein